MDLKTKSFIADTATIQISEQKLVSTIYGFKSLHINKTIKSTDYNCSH